MMPSDSGTKIRRYFRSLKLVAVTITRPGSFSGKVTTTKMYSRNPSNGDVLRGLGVVLEHLFVCLGVQERALLYTALHARGWSAFGRLQIYERNSTLVIANKSVQKPQLLAMLFKKKKRKIL